MPKPVKKKASAKKKAKPSSDPNRRARQLMDDHLDKLSQGKWARDFEPAGFNVAFGSETEHEIKATPSQMEMFEAMYRAKMSALGKKGGKASGKRRMTGLTSEKRSEVALKAAHARWKKRKARAETRDEGKRK